VLILVLERNSILLAQQDSTDLTLSELKLTLSLLTELEYRRAQDGLFTNKESIYKSIIEGYQNDQELYKQQVENLKLNIEAVTPAFYDNFWFGAAIAGIVVSSIYFLAR
jgi:hypothetical protein